MENNARCDVLITTSTRDLSWPFFSTYINDLLLTNSKKYAYADNLALIHISGNKQTIEKTLTHTLHAYL